jgi:hypothetical protein
MNVFIFSPPPDAKKISLPDDLRINKDIRKIFDDLKVPFDADLVEEKLSGYSNCESIDMIDIKSVIGKKVGSKFVIKISCTEEESDDEEGEGEEIRYVYISYIYIYLKL